MPAAQNQIRNTRKETFANRDQSHAGRDQLPPAREKGKNGEKGGRKKQTKAQKGKNHAVWFRVPPAPHSTDEEPRPGSCKSRECDGCSSWEAPVSTRARRVWGLAGGWRHGGAGAAERER